MIMFFLMITIGVSVGFMLMTSALSTSLKNYTEKASPFECGFNPMYTTRLPFSLQFFLIALIFIIFDIEIIILIPAPIKMFSTFSMALSTTILVLILTLGLLHEWDQGSLNWM